MARHQGKKKKATKPEAKDTPIPNLQAPIILPKRTNTPPKG